MIGRRNIIGLASVCALLGSALVAQGSAAAGNGQTIFECSHTAPVLEFHEPHCDNQEPTPLEFGHKAFLGTAEKPEEINLTNGGTKSGTTEPTPMVLSIPLLHGFSNVVVECTNVEGTGAAFNELSGTVHRGKGMLPAKFNNGTGVLCHTNQTGCVGGTATVGARVSEVKLSAETVEGMSLKEGGVSGGHGLKLFPTSGTQFGTVTFEGTCGLHAFGAIPVAGSVTGTAGGSREGRGATLFLVPGEMNSLTVGGSAAQLEGKGTIKRPSTGNAMVLTSF